MSILRCLNIAFTVSVLPNCLLSGSRARTFQMSLWPDLAAAAFVSASTSSGSLSPSSCIAQSYSLLCGFQTNGRIHTYTRKGSALDLPSSHLAVAVRTEVIIYCPWSSCAVQHLYIMYPFHSTFLLGTDCEDEQRTMRGA
ncbi:hypothetical protein B0H19DRAFT_1110171, partial [Mycena capillaripes]